MLYIDGISLNKIKNEFKNDLIGKKINKITQNSELSLTLHFGRTELFFSCSPTLPVCYIKEGAEASGGENSGLILNLRKYLNNAMLLDIEQLGLDRILIFKFSKLNELGQIKIYKIYFEMMGKHSNFFLTDKDNEIMELLKRFSLEENKLRPLFPGMTYEQPITAEKVSPYEVPEEKFQELLAHGSVFREVEGVGKALSDALQSYEHFQKILSDPLMPRIYYRDRKIVLGTVLEIAPKNYDSVMEFSSYKEFINYYIESQKLSSSYLNLKSKLLEKVNRETKKNEKIIRSIEIEKEEKKDYERYKELGDILASVLYSVKRGDTQAAAYDFYKNEMIEIELDSLLSPQGNLEKYYKRYNKMKKGLEISSERALKLFEEIEYLNSVKNFLESSENFENLKGIESELISQGYIKPEKNFNKKKKIQKELKYGVIEWKGDTVLYGRNNLENDNLSFKVAGKEDWWFHAKDIPGSHVIIKNENPSEEQVYKACEIAGFYSKANPGDKVKIDFVKRKNLNKPKGSKPGFVIYTGEKSLMIIKKNSIEEILKESD